MNNNITAKIINCLGMPEDGPGTVLVEFDSLMPIKGYIIEERAKALFEEVVAHVKRLPKPFLDPEGGWTFLNLPFYDNGHGMPGQQWGEQNDAALLCIICAYYGIVQDNLKALGFKDDVLKDTPGGVSYIAFNIEDDYLNLVRRHLGLTGSEKPSLIHRAARLVGLG